SSVTSFAKRFDAKGNGGGSGGCLLFIVVLYLDRLNRDPLRWGAFPRLIVWGKHELALAARADCVNNAPDFGKLGMLDVAYGETHPLEARDTDGPLALNTKEVDELPDMKYSPKPRRRRASKGAGVSWF
uniref:Uncharacterized protein n=2 Tax=Chenopodium quinoa TaxID=63459 RepID=A0A803MUE1_CHEQI